MHLLLPAILVAITILFVWEMSYSLRRSNTISRLVNTYMDDLQNEALIDEIYAHCTKDRKLRPVMQRYKANRSDIRMLFQKLLIWGNFRKGRRFVPISSFFFRTSLEYLLKHKDADDKQLTMEMMNFFHI